MVSTVTPGFRSAQGGVFLGGAVAVCAGACSQTQKRNSVAEKTKRWITEVERHVRLEWICSLSGRPSDPRGAPGLHRGERQMGKVSHSTSVGQVQGDVNG